MKNENKTCCEKCIQYADEYKNYGAHAFMCDCHQSQPSHFSYKEITKKIKDKYEQGVKEQSQPSDFLQVGRTHDVQQSTEDSEFEKIVSRMCAEFPIDKVDWNKSIAPYLREFQSLLAKAREEAKLEVYKSEALKQVIITEKEDTKQKILEYANDWLKVMWDMDIIDHDKWDDGLQEAESSLNSYLEGAHKLKDL